MYETRNTYCKETHRAQRGQALGSSKVSNCVDISHLNKHINKNAHDAGQLGWLIDNHLNQVGETISDRFWILYRQLKIEITITHTRRKLTLFLVVRLLMLNPKTGDLSLRKNCC